jgi:cobalamin biosynthesis protein, cobS family
MTVMIYVYVINLLLGLFNLIPITPLDGGRIVYSFSGNKIREFYNKIERYGILIIFVIVYFSGSRLTQGFLVIVDFFLKLAGIDINLTF